MKKVTITLLLLIFLAEAQGQDAVIDSLSNLSYSELDQYFYKTSVDSTNDVIYGKAYLNKAKRDQDDFRIVNAYYHLSKASEISSALLYCDSLISISDRFEKNGYFPALGYLQKGIINFNLGQYKNALNDYLSALFFAKEGGEKQVELGIRRNIATLKLITGDLKSALQDCKDYVDLIKVSDLDSKEIYLANSLYQLANAYYRNGIIDSTGIVLKEGYPMAIEAQDTVLIAHYTLLFGAFTYENGQYNAALDSLESGLKFIDKSSLSSDEFYAFIHLFKGKSYLKMNDRPLAIDYFKKVDAHVQNSSSREVFFLEIYKFLIDYYKKEGDLALQLKYVNNYLKADSLIQGKNRELENNIIYGFEIADILVERNELIGQLETKNERSQTFNIILISVSAVTLIFLIRMIRINRINKRKFKLIIQQLEEEKLSLTEQEINVKATQHSRKIQISKTDLPDEISNEILNKLKSFENENQFLKSYTLPTLAKELKTNGTYLSRVINTYKSTNFSNYLNELRVKYAINRLDEDKRFRMYTIEAIAKESGYNTAQSFSKAFQRRTGLKPSYFINQLNNQKNL